MRARGFSLIEVMIALAVMLVGAVGAMTGIMSANQSLRDGQLRLYKQVLIDASLQRARLYNKAKMYLSAATVTAATDMPPVEALGTGHWAIDPTTPLAGDLSRGALFFILPDGTMAPCTASTTPACPATITTCASTAIPDRVFCREMATTQSAAAFVPGTIVAAGTFVTTRWVRVIQKQPQLADTISGSVLAREVYAQ